MATLSLRLTGATELQVAFNQFRDTIEPLCRADVYAALERASKVSPGYLGGNSYTTPETANYVRTGNLGRSVQLEQNGLSSRLSVNAYSKGGFEYGGLVLGNAAGGGQAPLYAGIGWPTLRSAVDAEIDKLTTPGQGLDADLQDAAKGAGL